MPSEPRQWPVDLPVWQPQPKPYGAHEIVGALRDLIGS
jgi:hypothetical protein